MREREKLYITVDYKTTWQNSKSVTRLGGGTLQLRNSKFNKEKLPWNNNKLWFLWWITTNTPVTARNMRRVPPPHLHPSREVPEFPYSKVLWVTVWLKAVWGGCFESQFYLRPQEGTFCTSEHDRPLGQCTSRYVVWLLSCVWLVCDPMDSSLPGSSDHGIYQARILEWVAISFSWRCSRPRDQTRVSYIGGWILYPCAT